MQRLKAADVVIVGGGWVGLTMAKEIATRTSLSVVVLERGPARKMADYAAGMDEVDYSLRYRLMQNLADETATHRHSIRAAAVPIRQKDGKCVGPSVQAARDASYQPLSRPLFYYVNKKFADSKPHVPAFLKFAFTAGESEKLVSEVGYVPLPAQAYSLALAKFEARKTGSFFDGGSKVGVTVEELLADAGSAPAAGAKP